jgi:glycosyltransferase involved in cell wall biosynthesis
VGKATAIMDSRLDLSVCMIVKDEEQNLPQALASCEDLAEEIIILDTGSRDATPAIAASHPKVRLIHRPFSGFGEAKQHCLDHATRTWVLALDADERLSPELSAKLDSMIRNGQFHGAGGFWIRRRNWILGREMTSMGLQREFCLRLFRREGARYNGRPVHEGIELPPGRPVGRIEEPLEHATFRSVDQYLRKIDLYTSLELLEGKRRFSTAHLLVVLPSTFWRFYVARGGWRDGFAGLLWASLTAVGFFLRDVKLWIARQRNGVRA